ncbi:hypothetical protein [Barrientosiimonas humi]|uniref:hypothetical protein n=1 Tax=Barrientosiimonas humi TaxID=999931 RepID=UPI00370D9456
MAVEKPALPAVAVRVPVPDPTAGAHTGRVMALHPAGCGQVELNDSILKPPPSPLTPVIDTTASRPLPLAEMVNRAVLLWFPVPRQPVAVTVTSPETANAGTTAPIVTAGTDQATPLESVRLLTDMMNPPTP